LEQAKGRLDNINFYFTKKNLHVNGVVFFFHLDDPQVFKNIRSYLENYSFLDLHEMGNHQFSPTCELRRPFLEGMGSHFSFLLLHSFPRFFFSNIVFWNVANPLKLGDSFGHGS
jgi:hypothetical protein